MIGLGRQGDDRRVKSYRVHMYCIWGIIFQTQNTGHGSGKLEVGPLFLRKL